MRESDSLFTALLIGAALIGAALWYSKRNAPGAKGSANAAEFLGSSGSPDRDALGSGLRVTDEMRRTWSDITAMSMEDFALSGVTGPRVPTKPGV